MRLRLAALAISCSACLLLPLAVRAQDEPEPTPPVETPPRADPPPTPEPKKSAEDEQAEAKALAGVEYFPLDQGRRWRYRVRFRILPAAEEAEEGAQPEAEEGEHHVDVYVTEPVKIGEQKAAALEWKLDQVLSQRAYFRVKDGNLLCLRRLQGASVHVKEFVLTPAQPTLKETLEVGQEWSWEGKSGPSAGKQTFKVLRAEDVESPAGTFKTLVVEAEFTGEDDSRGKTTRWLAPGVGLVKEISWVRTPKHVFHTEGVLIRFEKP